jgi:hypothetical protein
LLNSEFCRPEAPLSAVLAVAKLKMLVLAFANKPGQPGPGLAKMEPLLGPADPKMEGFGFSKAGGWVERGCCEGAGSGFWSFRKRLAKRLEVWVSPSKLLLKMLNGC